MFAVQQYAEAGAIMMPLDEERGTYSAGFGGEPSPMYPDADAAPDDDSTPMSFPEELARVVFSSLLSSLRECHTKGVAHRDVKPENMVASQDGKVRLTDFSSCYMFKRPSGLLVDAIDALVTGETRVTTSSRSASVTAPSMASGTKTDREIRKEHAKVDGGNEADSGQAAGTASQQDPSGFGTVLESA